MNDQRPSVDHLPGDAHGGGRLLDWHRPVGRVGRLIRFVRGRSFDANPYLRNGWDQRIDPHELAIAGHPTPDDRGGGGAHGDGGPAPEGDEGTARDVPDLRDGLQTWQVLHNVTYGYPGANPAPETGTNDGGVPADSHPRPVVRLWPRLAPIDGYVKAEPTDG